MTSSRREALRRQQAAQAKQKRLTRIVIAGAAIAALVLVAVFGTILVQGMNRPTTASVPVNATSAKDGIIVNPGKPVAGAPVVQLFVDYQCPVCKSFEGIFGPTLKDMASKGEIQLEYHTMTFLDTNLRNDSSIRAGIAAACSDNVGKYSDYHDTVFSNQPATEGTGYTTDQLRREFAATAGITGADLTTFQQCYDSKAMAGFVNGTNDLASKSGVNSTPTLKVNGKVLENKTLPTSNPAQLRDLILAS
ncbi:MAG: thioredoxin domain-containing protein [Micropruina sp.]|nr:thioredoxin domain-containing protein [Micropruina sp.]